MDKEERDKEIIMLSWQIYFMGVARIDDVTREQLWISLRAPPFKVGVTGGAQKRKRRGEKKRTSFSLKMAENGETNAPVGTNMKRQSSKVAVTRKFVRRQDQTDRRKSRMATNADSLKDEQVLYIIYNSLF